MLISLIAAIDLEMAIGKDNALPWHLPADLRTFRKTTMGKPIVMGRRTFESIGKPLPGRANIVLSRDPNFQASGCHVVHCVEAAIAAAGDVDELMVIGGAGVFEEFLAQADRLYLTVVSGTFAGDVFFPAFDEAQWRVEHSETTLADANNRWGHTLFVLERVAQKPLWSRSQQQPAHLPQLLLPGK
ncbi:MAG: type 3 dihydrofolate reductase [Bradymonadaceae bacterium]|nr:type 3 dihydrofolate reductase [Lujinxingiaceae bacterium]